MRPSGSEPVAPGPEPIELTFIARIANMAVAISDRVIKCAPRLPEGVTMTFSRVRERIIRRPENGANVYPVNGGQTVTIGDLSRDEAHRLMVLLLEKEGMEYIGFDIGRVLYPESVEKVS